MKNFSLGACAKLVEWNLGLASTLALFSCSNEDLLNSQDNYSIEATLTANSIWTTENARQFATRAEDTPQYLYMIYVFDSDGKALKNGGHYMAKLSSKIIFSDAISTTGTYTFYGVTNILSGEYPRTADTPGFSSSQTFTIASTETPADICLGKQQLEVTADKQSYFVTINVDHIMSKLALTVHSVPADVTSLSVTLPSQANTFDFSKTFTGNTQSQTIALTKATTANTDGTYEWTAPATVVFPCAKGTTSMPITITWGPYDGIDNVDSKKVVSTTSSTCCLSGKNLSLSTTWDKSINTSFSIISNEWAASEEGTFTW